jgi:tetratricopeptide (TPR) repeat protein
LYDDALAHYDRAIQIKPEYAEAWGNKAITLYELKLYDDALAHYDRAIQIKPEYAEAWGNKGIVLNELKLHNDALAHYDRAIQIKPEYAEAWNNKGIVLNELKLHDDALAHYDRAIQIKPEYAEAWNNKGVALNELKLYDDALAHYDRAIQIKPEYVEAWANKGIVLNELKLHNDALVHYDRAIQIKPEYTEAWNNKGIVLNELKLYDDALAHYDQAIQIKPEYAEAWANKGVTLNELKLYDDALAHYDRAIQIKPECAETDLNKGLLNLFLKKFDIGFKSYESRLKNKKIIDFEFPIDKCIVPLWNGESVCKKLLVISEQGIGDDIFYIRFIKNILPIVEKITVITDLRLVPIFSRAFPDVKFLAKGLRLNDHSYDYQVAIASLPLILKLDSLTKDTTQKPYLIDNLALTQKIKNSENFSSNFNCGLAWRSLNKKIGKSKSISLSDLKEVLDASGCTFFNLQYGEVRDDLEQLDELMGIKILEVEGIDIFSNIDGLLSIIKACDAVVTTSNITAHLAGAIGKKTFLLLPYSRGRNWYWHDETVSTWYPSIYQYYQAKDLSWDVAIKEIAQKLGDEIARKN